MVNYSIVYYKEVLFYSSLMLEYIYSNKISIPLLLLVFLKSVYTSLPIAAALSVIISNY